MSVLGGIWRAEPVGTAWLLHSAKVPTGRKAGAEAMIDQQRHYSLQSVIPITIWRTVADTAAIMAPASSPR